MECTSEGQWSVIHSLWLEGTETVKFMEEWQSSLVITVAVGGKFQRMADKYCWWMMFWVTINCNMFMIRSRSYCIFVTTEESTLMRLNLKWVCHCDDKVEEVVQEFFKSQSKHFILKEAGNLWHWTNYHVMLTFITNMPLVVSSPLYKLMSPACRIIRGQFLCWAAMSAKFTSISHSKETLKGEMIL